MQGTSQSIKYWISQNDEYPFYYHRDSIYRGTWVDFVENLSEITGRDTELITERDGQEISASEALDMLDVGELDMVLGMPGEICGDSGRICSQGVSGSELTAYILEGSPQAGVGDYANCYWAIDSSLKDILNGTPFEGHTLDYADRTQLYEALERGDVYGVIDKRGEFDYDAFVGRDFKYRQCIGVSVPYTECAYVRKGDDELLAAVNEASDMAKQSAGLGYTNLLADSYAKSAGFEKATYTLGIAAFVLAAGCAVLAVKLRQNRSRADAKLRTVIAGEASKELLELNLNNGKLYSYNDFAIFGERGRELPNPVKLTELTELTGYDFVSHYSGVSKHIKTKYSGRMIIHIGGVKLFVAEEGVRTGHILMLTFTRL